MVTMMINNNILRRNLIVCSLYLLLAGGLAGCQSQAETLPAAPATQAVEPGQPTLTGTQASTAPAPILPENSETDPAAIEIAWQSSSHANSFVLDEEGHNNTCARCHAPINWMPSMDELPESCFACKFEVEDPPLLIAENEWSNVSCRVCHKADKKDNIEPEYVWLEIAPLEEYAAVASTTELCLKCHAPVDVPKHNGVEVGGAHASYDCTGCHSAHTTSTSCDAAGCHPDVVQPAVPIAGHDEDHQAVSCVACHDGSGMEVGLDEEKGLWTTFMSGPADSGADRTAFTSHNVVLEAECDRCHFADNPWSLSDQVEEP